MRSRAFNSAVCGAFLVCAVVTATVVPSTGTAAVIAPPAKGFSGVFSGEGLTLRLRHDPTTDRYVGSLTETGSVDPVDVKVAGRTFDGTVVVGARPQSIHATIVRDTVTLQRGTQRNTLLRTPDSFGELAVQRSRLAASNNTSTNNTSTNEPSTTPNAQPNAFSENASSSLLAAAMPTGESTPPPAAPFVKTGVRLSYVFATATFPGILSPEPNDLSVWVDPQTGRQYNTGSASSLSIDQLTITDVVDGMAITDYEGYLVNLEAQAVSTSMSGAYRLPVGHGGEYWISPQALAKVTDGDQNGVTVKHLNYTTGGKSYRAIRFLDPPGSTREHHTYDLESGMLLAYGLSSVTANVTVVGADGTKTNGAGSTTLGVKTLVNVRQVTLPWLGQRAGVDAQPHGTINWVGTKTYAVESASTSTYRNTARWEVQRSDATMFDFHSKSTLDLSQNGQNPNVTEGDTSALVSSFWIDPQVLAGLTKGQVLDDDPITHLRVAVLGAQKGIVYISQRGPIENSVAGFDLQTGQIRAVRLQQGTGVGTTTTFLQRGR